jgi:hypothetical protein
MVYRGTYRNGVVVLDGKPDLPEGAAVEVSAVPERQPSDPAQPQASSESLEEFIGMAGDLPPDFAEEHDHYIHGTPKRGRKSSGGRGFGRA